MDLVNIISRWLHVASAVVLVGGFLLIALAVEPALRGRPDGETLAADIRQRFKRMAHTAAGLLLITGFYNYLALAIPRARDAGIAGPYNGVMGAKMLMGLAVAAGWRRRGIGLVSGGETAPFDLHLDDDFGWDDGLICGGSASILIQPMGRLDPAPFQAAIDLHESRGRGVFCAIVSAPDASLIGHSCLMLDGGAPVCEIPDAAARQAVEEAASALLAEGREAPQRVVFKELDVVAY